jgi:phosphoribosylamine---glycine ligase
VKFFIISEGGDGAGFALRLQEEGHDVSIWIRDDEATANCKGLIKHDEGFAVDSDTIIVADCTGAGVLCDSYRDNGHPVLGGSAVADKLEADRGFATDVFKECGVKTPKAKHFDDWEQARAFIETSKERLVFKPEGDLSGVVPSYVSYDSEDMLEMLEFYKGLRERVAPAFTLQEFIKGTCVSSEAWFSVDHFVLPFNHTIERKQLMNGDIGPSGGCTGNVVWSCEECEACPVCKATLYKIEDFLRSVSYVGPVDINAVVGDYGIFALEFTPRFGYDATPTLLSALLASPLGVFLEAVARGVCSEMPLFPGFAAGVRVSVPPWPSEEFHAKPGLPLRGLKNFDKFYPYNVMRSEDGTYITSGGYGITGVALGTGSKIEEAFEDAYKVAKRLRLPDKQFRTDLAEVCNTDFRRLNSFIRAHSVSEGRE